MKSGVNGGEVRTACQLCTLSLRVAHYPVSAR